MATTLPTLTRTMDNAFQTTWMTIQKEATDNILLATVIWATLMNAGCMTPKVGGKYIERTIRYGQATATAIADGDSLPQEEVELETSALWTWRHIAGSVSRSFFDDQQNQGPDAIKSLVGMKLEAVRDALEQKFESNMWNTFVSGETGSEFQGLNDMVPSIANRSTGTYGGINRPLTYSDEANGVYVPATGNTWWGPKYFPGTLANIEDNLIDDMKASFNSSSANQSSPNLIVASQSICELYETFALDASQIIKDSGTQLADLGFEVLRFKGKPMVWTPSITANNLLMLNTDFIEVVYDPSVWFEMTDWKPIPLEPKRIAHIMCTANMISTQLRRHLRMEYA